MPCPDLPPSDRNTRCGTSFRSVGSSANDLGRREIDCSWYFDAQCTISDKALQSSAGLAGFLGIPLLGVVPSHLFPPPGTLTNRNMGGGQHPSTRPPLPTTQARMSHAGAASM